MIIAIYTKASINRRDFEEGSPIEEKTELSRWDIDLSTLSVTSHNAMYLEVSSRYLEGSLRVAALSPYIQSPSMAAVESDSVIVRSETLKKIRIFQSKEGNQSHIYIIYTKMINPHIAP